MSLYPILWALEHAPVIDAEERAILAALVNKGDFDGCNCYRSYPRLAQVARVDPKTARRKCHAMEERGVIRRQPGPKPKGWLKLPRDKRPVVWEAMIPASFWSAVQLDEVNQARAERDRAPITPTSRPDLADAPPKKARADKGKDRPDRRKNRGDSQSPREEPTGGTHSPLARGLTVPSRGDSQSPNPPIEPSDVPSSPPAPPASGGTETPVVAEDSGGEDESSTEAGNTLSRAEGIVDAAVRCWGSGHRAPTVRDRQRLSERVAVELGNGGDDRVILDELTRDLGDARSAVSVVLGARTATPGWGRSVDPRPDVSRYEVTGPRPPWCGVCSERTRLVELDDGRLRQCRRCHPARVDRDQEVSSNGGNEVPPPLEELSADLEASTPASASASAPRPRGGPDPKRVDLDALKAGFAAQAEKYQT